MPLMRSLVERAAGDYKLHPHYHDIVACASHILRTVVTEDTLHELSGSADPAPREDVMENYWGTTAWGVDSRNGDHELRTIVEAILREINPNLLGQANEPDE